MPRPCVAVTVSGVQSRVLLGAIRPEGGPIEFITTLGDGGFCCDLPIPPHGLVVLLWELCGSSGRRSLLSHSFVQSSHLDVCFRVVAGDQKQARVVLEGTVLEPLVKTCPDDDGDDDENHILALAAHNAL